MTHPHQKTKGWVPPAAFSSLSLQRSSCQWFEKTRGVKFSDSFPLDDSKILPGKWVFHQTSVKKWLFRVLGRDVFSGGRNFENRRIKDSKNRDSSLSSRVWKKDHHLPKKRKKHIQFSARFILKHQRPRYQNCYLTLAAGLLDTPSPDPLTKMRAPEPVIRRCTVSLFLLGT